MLEHAYDKVDYISLHAYYEEHDGDLGSFLARRWTWTRSSTPWWRRATRSAARKHRKQISISFDEWNVWYSIAVRRRGGPRRSRSGLA